MENADTNFQSFVIPSSIAKRAIRSENSKKGLILMLIKVNHNNYSYKNSWKNATY